MLLYRLFFLLPILSSVSSVSLWFISSRPAFVATSLHTHKDERSRDDEAPQTVSRRNAMPRENIEGVEIPLDPEAVGSENPMAPGEPDPARQEASSPVPGTGYERKREHMAEHDAEGNVEDSPRHPNEFIDRGSNPTR
jgi:hypothetical protein